ncbi:MAG TPA: hypothetical protein VMK66_19410 [Myxococcales bacterium]|nr:hypothetical protein [Myxococcales bacterium]
MKKMMFLGIAAAGLMVGAPLALANGDQANSSQTATSTSKTSASEKSVSGKIASIDKDHKSVTIEENGTQQELKVGNATAITREGSSMSFAELKSGDQVRASFNPSTKEATRLEVQQKK